MLTHIKEWGKYVEITGFRKIDVKYAKEFVKSARRELPKGSCVQFFDAGLVASWQHLYFAVFNALLAFNNGLSISKSLAMEVMLYASAQRQIRKAIDLMGVKCAVVDVAVVIISKSAESAEALLSAVSKHLGKKPDESTLEISKEKAENIREAFGVTETELKAALEKDNNADTLIDLIIERVALLSTQL
jgi:KEOPS complex subunit Cgi121